MLSLPRVTLFSRFVLPTDLYGNDESEYAVPTDQGDSAQEPQEQALSAPKKESPPPAKALSSPKPAVNVPSTPPKQEASLSPTESTSQQISASNGATSSYSVAQTQQIPTYQERDINDYHEQGHQGGAGNFPGASPRPVRPSEMKEEG